jgi:hypothetical protein
MTLESPVKLKRFWLFCVAVLAMLALVHDPAVAQDRRSTIALEGYVGTAPANLQPVADIKLQFSGKSYDFAVTRSRVLRGRRSARQILNDIRPRQNILILQGSESAMAPLTSASPGTQLSITGEHRQGSNQLSVTQMGPVAAKPSSTDTKH